MPATEQTWRNQLLLHKVFAITGIAMFAATIWMLAADHMREWKSIQRNFVQVETQMNRWQQQQYLTDERLSEALSAARSAPLDEQLLSSFKDQVQEDAARRELPAYSFENLDEQVAKLHELAQIAAEWRSARDDLRQREEALEREAAEAQLAARTARTAIAGAQDLTAAESAASEAAEHAETLLAQAQEVAKEARAAEQETAEAEMDAAVQRERVLSTLNSIVRAARFREDKVLTQRKFQNADLDAQKANIDLAVRDHRGQDAIQALQDRVDQSKQQLEVLTLAYQEASQHRKELQGLVGKMTEEESLAAKAVEENTAKLEQLETALAQTRSTFFVNDFPWLGKRWLELPIIDAFGNPRKIDNLWDGQNTINYNFANVRRFDRCTTCHQAIERTAAGSPVDPAYVKQRDVLLTLSTPSKEEIEQLVQANNGKQLTLEQVYGIRLADHGLLRRDDVTVNFVEQKTRGAKAALELAEGYRQPQVGEQIRQAVMQARPNLPRAQDAASGDRPGLIVGDVIAYVNGDRVTDLQQAQRLLMGPSVNWGEPITLTVRRGLPNPYVTHPRMDLFIGSLSPHKLADFACTICHEGQGSATAFKWASHTPNDPQQRRQWALEYGWFDNHHWIYPQYPERFVQSACLKCHHDVVELEPSQQFPEPPAPKVVHGYSLVRKYGCYGCHEISGYSGPQKRIGPDLRLEPNFFAAAQQLKTDPNFEKLTLVERNWVDELIEHPEHSETRRQLYELLLQDQAADEPRLTQRAHSLAPLLKDVEVPGTLRRAGPSLRFVSHKLDPEFLYDWIRKPKDFRPSTRMPQFFGLWDHLEDDEHAQEIARKYEPIEILGIVTYLLDRSEEQKFDYLAPEEVDSSEAEAAVQRGKTLFQTRGCLACHTHRDFPEVQQYRQADDVVQGPDLSDVGTKFEAQRNPNGPQWLYSWIKEPSRYHVRTLMPHLFLDPIAEEDEMGNRSMTDPAADIVQYLLTSKNNWRPTDTPYDPQTKQLDLGAQDEEALNELALEHLKDAFYESTAKRYLETGIPEDLRSELKGAEIELVGSEITNKEKLLYVGRKTVTKYGCHGCHDIPGFEDAKPIGTGLADWGRKDPSRLAFEHIGHYVEAQHHGSEHALDDGESQGDRGFFMEALASQHRAGFIYQKLREPRSYDYHKTENKRFNEWLRMPQFPLDARDREAVITFVLGLVAEPPAPKFVYSATPRQAAIAAGRQVLEKYNCGGCHVLEPEQWQLAYPQGAFGTQASKETFPFLGTHYTPEQLAAMSEPDRRALLHATISGMPAISNADALPEVIDSEGDPVEEEEPYRPHTLQYAFSLWSPAVLDGNVFDVGAVPVRIPADYIEAKYPPRGGVLAQYLLPHVYAMKAEANPNKGAQTWGWVPPPLNGEGNKVQTEWLHDFLLDPYPIRPSVVLRMPRFNMSSDEAAKLVNYFAAMDNAQYPYASSERRQTSRLTKAEEDYHKSLADLPDQQAPDSDQQAPESNQQAPPEGYRLSDAMNIVTNKNYCITCHIISDFEPQTSDQAKAPNLARVYQRLRPDYVRDWIANPARILPYTGMPVNIEYVSGAPYLGGVPQDLYHGTSVEQLDAVVDLLMNFDEYAKRRSPIAPLVQAAAEQPAAESDSLPPQDVEPTAEAPPASATN